MNIVFEASHPAGDETQSPRRHRNVRFILPVLAFLWALAVSAGLWVLWGYENAPGAGANPPRLWPTDSRIQREPGRATLVILAHPRCPCSRASIGELASIIAHTQGRVSASVVFLKPAGFSDDWEKTDLWQSAVDIPGVTAIIDEGGAEARLFGAKTSGQTLLYGADGRLLFSRKQIMQPTVLDLNQVIFETSKMLQRLIGEDIDLLLGLIPNLGKVKADRGQIEQVLMNLCINARDAMPKGGKLTIATADVCLDEEYASRHVSVQPGRYIMLAVSDTGCGMDTQTRERIFEPFFTTKEMGKGTGLGLSTVYGIVKQSGGNIWVYSEVGRGTTFKIYLPCLETPAEELQPGNAQVKMPKGAETVLLVEDEEMVRGMAREILQESGYHVLEATQGHEALLVAERHDGPIHLMLSDVVMPRMSGRELAERLVPLRGEMKVLYMSGYTDDAIVHHGVLDEGMAFIEKPFTPISLACKVREVLNEPLTLSS